MKQNNLNKKRFLYNEFWMLSVMGAFQHSGVYKIATETQRKDFKNALKEHINTQILPLYHNKVENDPHIANIINLMEFANTHSYVNMNIGIAQKLLNLYLKYLWCDGEIPTPPHFPVDRTIQMELGIKVTDIVPWTQMEGKKGLEDYNMIINKAKVLLNNDEHKDCANITELELKLFGQNITKNKL